RLNSVLPDLHCIFTIYDLNGCPIANFNSGVRASDDTFNYAVTKEFACEIQELPLLPGKYRLNVALSSGTELQDHVEGAATFSVVPGPIAERDVKSANGYGSVYIAHRWM